MPGYRKTKAVDMSKMQEGAKRELEYQKGYARSQSAKVEREEAAGRIPSGEARRRQAAYGRVTSGMREGKESPAKQGTLSALAEGIAKLAKFGKKVQGGAEDLGQLPEKTKKKRKGS